MKHLFSMATLLSLLIVSETLAQYPYKTIRQIQEVANLVSPPPADASPLLGDTVWVRGIVATSARVNGGPFLWFTGDRIRFAIKDPNETIFNYITVVASDTTFFKGIGLDHLVAGDSVEILGRITEFRTLTQLEVIKVSDSFNLLGTSSANLAAVERPVSDFYNGTVNTRNPGEYYESAFIKFSGLTVISTTATEFVAADANGNQITVDDNSNQIFSSTPPPAGVTVALPPTSPARCRRAG